VTTLLSPPGLAGSAAARDAVRAAAEVPVWSLTDTQLAAEIGQVLALRAQADALLLARLGEADTRGLARARGATSLTAWLRGSHQLGVTAACRRWYWLHWARLHLAFSDGSWLTCVTSVGGGRGKVDRVVAALRLEGASSPGLPAPH